MPSLRSAAKSILKHVAFTTPLHKSLFSAYPYMFSPSELMFLAQCVNDVADVPGSFVEAGCAYGATTVWLNRYLADIHDYRDYYALDTFSGFAPAHVQYEWLHRHKSQEVHDALQSTFGDNKKRWFDRTMKANHCHRVHSVQCDVATYDFFTVAPIAFCLLDVDLYLPIKEALPKIFTCMSPGGIIVVDDCWDDEKWDGALHAFKEFTEGLQINCCIWGRKLGVIRM